MNKDLQREILAIAGYGPVAKRDDWKREEVEVPEEKPPLFQPKNTYGDMTEMRRLAGITTQFPHHQRHEGVAKPMTLLEWGIRKRGQKGEDAAADLNAALSEARDLLDEVLDGLGPVDVAEVSHDFFGRLIGQVHKRRMAEALVRWGIDAEPRYQLPSALALIDQTRKKFGLPMSSIPALGAHV